MAAEDRQQNEPELLGVPAAEYHAAEKARYALERMTFETEYAEWQRQVALSETATNQSVEATVEKVSLLDRVAAVWAVVEKVVEEMIIHAEAFKAAETGAEKKKYVMAEIVRWLVLVEEEKDLLPPLVEKLAFAAVRYFLPALIERVFRRLDASGLVNVA